MRAALVVPGNILCAQMAEMFLAKTDEEIQAFLFGAMDKSLGISVEVRLAWPYPLHINSLIVQARIKVLGVLAVKIRGAGSLACSPSPIPVHQSILAR